MAMKDITLKIIGKQIIDGEPSDNIEFVTEGKMYDRNQSRYIAYDETEFTGFPGCKTVLKFSGESIKMKRFGAGSEIEFFFTEGERFSGRYKTPYGVIHMEILTKAIENGFDENGYGEAKISYDLSLSGVAESSNELTINVME